VRPMLNTAKQTATEAATRPAALPKIPEKAPGVAAAATAMAEPAPMSVPRYAALSSREQAVIGKSLVIKGEVTGSESLCIEGQVEGSISLSGDADRVTVGRTGVVSANLVAREIVVMGKVRGNLEASDRVDIRNDGSLTGDVVTQRITIEDGAFFKGNVDIRKPAQKG
jgi:cytoskeletal protein CcmA (bactofilin family)